MGYLKWNCLSEEEMFERKLLGNMLVNTGAAVYWAPKKIKFLQPANHIIHKAIKKLVKEGMPIDFVTVAELLGKRNKIDVVGGLDYLTELIRSNGY